MQMNVERKKKKTREMFNVVATSRVTGGKRGGLCPVSFM